MKEVRIISSAETYPLRHKVLWPHIEKEKDCITDVDDHEGTFHLGTFSGDQLTSIGTFFPAHTPKLPEVESSFRLRAMATDPNYRGQGMGQDLILGALEILREKGADRLWCDARKVAIGFYEKLGFSKIDEWYEVRNVGPHQLMYYEFKTIS